MNCHVVNLTGCNLFYGQSELKLCCWIVLSAINIRLLFVWFSSISADFAHFDIFHKSNNLPHKSCFHWSLTCILILWDQSCLASLNPHYVGLRSPIVKTILKFLTLPVFHFNCATFFCYIQMRKRKTKQQTTWKESN